MLLDEVESATILSRFCSMYSNTAVSFEIWKHLQHIVTNTNSQLSISQWPLALRMAVGVALPRAPEWPADLEQCDPQRNTSPHHSHTIAAEK